MPPVTSEAKMTGRDFLTGKRNSPAAWDTDSKPTNAHGARRTMPITCTAGSLLTGAKSGKSFAKPPLCAVMQPKQTATQTNSSTAQTVCTRRIHLRLSAQISPIAQSSAPDSSTSPSHTV